MKIEHLHLSTKVKNYFLISQPKHIELWVLKDSFDTTYGDLKKILTYLRNFFLYQDL